jgi:hypothetical protein
LDRSFRHLCQAKVDQQRPLAPLHQHITRIHVPVDDPLLVGVVEGVGDLVDDPHRQLQVQWLVDHIFESAYLHVLHDDVGQIVLLAKVVNWQDVGMAQFCDGLGLALEASQESLVSVSQHKREVSSLSVNNVDNMQSWHLPATCQCSPWLHP